MASPSKAGSRRRGRQSLGEAAAGGKQEDRPSEQDGDRRAAAAVSRGCRSVSDALPTQWRTHAAPALGRICTAHKLHVRAILNTELTVVVRVVAPSHVDVHRASFSLWLSCAA